MGADDDATCVEHVWQLVGLALIDGYGAATEYECVRCDAVIHVAPGDPMPQTI